MTDEDHPNPLVTFDWTDSESPSRAVVTAVADEVGEDPIRISPLYDAVDTDALDNIFDIGSYSHPSPTGCVEFEYENHWVMVKANGRGYLYDRDIRTAVSGDLDDDSVAEYTH